MAGDLPFELDTFDAIAEAKGGKRCIAIMIRVFPFLFHLVCAALEFLAFNAVNEKLTIVCIEFYEIAELVELFMILNYSCVLPDVIYSVLGPISVFMIYNNPYGVFFNLSAAFVNIANGALFFTRYRNCGNEEQELIPMLPFIAFASGLLHIVIAVIGHLSFTRFDKEGELYCGRFEDCIEDLRKH